MRVLPNTFAYFYLALYGGVSVLDLPVTPPAFAFGSSLPIASQPVAFGVP